MIKFDWTGNNQFYVGQLPVFGLKLLGEVHGVIDEGETSGLATSKLGFEPKCEATISSARVHLCQLLPHLGMEIFVKFRSREESFEPHNG